MDKLIVENLRRALVQLEAAHKKIKKYDPDNSAVDSDILVIKHKVSEMALDYGYRGAVKGDAR